MNLHSIESKDNQLIKHIVKLSENKRYRLESKEAVIYGEHLIIEALKNNLIKKIFVLDNALHRYMNLDIDDNIEVYALSQEPMKKINILDSISEIVAIIEIPKSAQIDYTQDSIILESIQDPGNLGTILRAAKASGINQVILSANSADIYNPKVLRASQGIQLSLNVVVDCNLVEELPKFDAQIFALIPSAKESIYNQDLTKPTVLLLGNEGNGLSEDVLALVAKQNQVSIPMPGGSESINLAMATTIAVFELSRQRSVK